MFTSARSAQVAVNGDKMNYLVFGKGPKTLVILPGLGDGLTRFMVSFRHSLLRSATDGLPGISKFICSAAAIRCPQSIPRGRWLPIRRLP